MSVNFGLPIYVWFLFDPYFICWNPWFFCQYLFFVFPCAGNLHGEFPVDCIQSVAKENERVMCGWRGRTVSHWWGGNVQVCARNYSGAQFIAPIRGPILSPILAPRPTGDWEGEIHESCGNTTLWPLMWSIRWPNHVHVKCIPHVFMPLFD